MYFLFIYSGVQSYCCQCAFIHIIWMFLVSLHILLRANIAVFDVVDLFPFHDSAGNKGWGHPILVW